MTPRLYTLAYLFSFSFHASRISFSRHAEVLVLEVMTRVWRNADKYSASLASVSTWIFTITRNQRIDILRKLNRTRAEIVIETEDLWQIPTEDTTICSIQNLSTEKFVKSAIDKLPEEQMVALQKISAGAKVPQHTHKGFEYTVILSGGYSDELGVYHEGDFIARDASHKHSPTALQNEDCICLTVLNAPLKFTGWYRVLNPFMAWS